MDPPYFADSCGKGGPGAPYRLQTFINSSREFRAALSEKQRQTFKEYPDAASMLKAIEAVAKSHPSQSSILTKCCRKISNLAERLSPFFKVIDLLVSSHPEVAAIAWGSIRLVFVLGSKYVVFLERVADMFEMMSANLSIYEDAVKRLTERGHQSNSMDQLLHAMGYVYADLLQFCFDISQAFSKRGSKIMSLRESFLWSLSPKLSSPFNLKFDTLLKRWNTHQKVVELALRNVEAQEQQENMDIIGNILQRFATEASFEPQPNPNRPDIRTPQQVFEKLRKWINPSNWMRKFENAQSQRSERSTEWFLHHGLIDSWMDGLGADQKAGPSVVSIQGKPGFGKTTLCATLVEHLQQRNRNKSHHDPITFYFFDKQDRETSSVSTSWRAILVQMLYVMMWCDPQVLDICLMLREEKESALMFASEQEVMSTVYLLSQRIPGLCLIIDGLDECDAPREFLTRMRPLLDGSGSVSIALFSRPTVLLTPDLDKKLGTLTLDSTLNLTDIELFIQPRLEKLLQDELISSSIHLESAMHDIAVRADGMFLWAVLFMEYLEAPHLSVRQRQVAIRDVNRLEGLDSLYMTILQSIAQVNKAAWTMIIQTFGLILAAIRPLHVTELQHLIATPLDRSLEQDDLIPDFWRRLGVMSGALVEIDRNGLVGFIHLSLAEYFKDDQNLLPAGSRVDEYTSHEQLACKCLSYLYFTVMAEPLAGESRTSADIDLLWEQHPLLNYATEFWSVHTVKCLEDIRRATAINRKNALVRLATQFLHKKQAVLVWIEASWTFQRAPKIRYGPQDPFFENALVLPTGLRGEEKEIYETAQTTLLELAKDLEQLELSWSHILLDEPYEIWDASLTAFTTSKFWKGEDGAAAVTEFNDKYDAAVSICLKSRLSVDGTRMAIVRLYIQDYGSPFQTLFELWNLKSKAKLSETVLSVPKGCLKPFLPRSWLQNDMPNSSLHCEFQFPIGITSDLSRVALPGCVSQMQCSDTSSAEDLSLFDMTEDTQYFDFTGNCRRHAHLNLQLEDLEQAYEVQISDSREFLVTIHRSNGMVDVDPTLRTNMSFITVYHDPNKEALRRPQYRYVNSIATSLAASHCMTLHPTAPVIALSATTLAYVDTSRNLRVKENNQKLVLWKFLSSNARKPLLFIDPPNGNLPKRLHFDLDGEYFCGVAIGKWAREDHQSGNLPLQNSQQCTTSQELVTRKGPNTLALPYRTERPSVQVQGKLASFVDAFGLRSISQLQDSGHGGVLLATLREGGLVDAELLTRLPQEIARDYEASMLTPTIAEEDEVTRLVLKQDDRLFRKHRVEVETEQSGVQLPVLLERSRETIPRATGEGVWTSGGLELFGQTRKRLGLFPDDRDCKRRSV